MLHKNQQQQTQHLTQQQTQKQNQIFSGGIIFDLESLFYVLFGARAHFRALLCALLAIIAEGEARLDFYFDLFRWWRNRMQQQCSKTKANSLSLRLLKGAAMHYSSDVLLKKETHHMSSG